MTVDSFDFNDSSRVSGDLRKTTEDWLSTATKEFVARMGNQISDGLDVTFKSLELKTMREVLRSGDQQHVAFVLELDQKSSAMWLLPRQLGILLILAILGEKNESMPQDREMTPIELSLLELCLSELADSLVEAWTLGDPLQIKVREFVKIPQKYREFDLDQKTLCCCMNLTLNELGGDWQLIILLEDLETIVTERQQVAFGESDRAALVEVAKQIPVELRIVLGKAKLHVSEISKLQVGDVVLLGQKVSDNLVVNVQSRPKLAAWLGRRGKRHAIQVTSVVES